MNPQSFTHKSQEAIQHAQTIANEHGQPQVEPPHLFFALLEQEEGVVVSVLKKMNVDIERLRTHIEAMIASLPRQFGMMNTGGMGQVLMGQAMMFILNH